MINKQTHGRTPRVNEGGGEGGKAEGRRRRRRGGKGGGEGRGKGGGEMRKMEGRGGETRESYSISNQWIDRGLIID